MQVATLTEREASVASALHERELLMDKAAQLLAVGKDKAAEATRKRAASLLGGLPISALHPPTVIGASSEAFSDSLQIFLRSPAAKDLLADERMPPGMSAPHKCPT